MNRYINSIVLCLLILFVTYSGVEPSVKDPRHIGESFLSALKARDFQKLAGCFQREVRGRFLTPGSGFIEASGSLVVAGKFRKWFGGVDSFIIEESKVNQLSDSKIHISYRIRLSSDTCLTQQIYAVVKEGLIEAINLLCSGPYKPAIRQ